MLFLVIAIQYAFYNCRNCMCFSLYPAFHSFRNSVPCRVKMAESEGKFDFAIDRGGTFTDVFARLPDGRERVLKLLSRDPQNYKDAPTEGIRRVLEEVS